MKKPVLVVLAAGMGSRYGGLKQIDPVGAHGQSIIDYSIYDARRAGFETVIFIIKHEIEEAFRAAIGDRVARGMDVRYAFQELNDLPAGYAVPAGRKKPWGTTHAVLAARESIDGPFVVVNGDDYYGPSAFETMYRYLTANPDRPDCYQYAMVGYLLGNTVTENGSVARGVCRESADHLLEAIVERTSLEKEGDGARYTGEDGRTVHLPGSTVVSMNFWGLQRSFIDEALRRFPAFLDRTLAENPEKGEYFLPLVISQLIEERRAQVRVLPCQEKWYGVTYREDKPSVEGAVAEKTGQGLYPERLWPEA